MISGATMVHPTTTGRNRILVEAYDETLIDDLRKKTDVLHGHGTTLFAQLVHLGREWAVTDSDYPPMAPSSLRSPRDAYPPKEMSVQDIDTIVDAFGRSALNMQRAGFDGIEIHGAHGYLVSQFLSPATNYRTDAYGGSAEKRHRFLLELVSRIRHYCGDDFGLSVRLSADEELYDGLEIPDTIKIVQALEKHGGVDLISITLGTRGAYVKDMTAPEATAANAAKAIKNACDLPILLGQRISNPELANELLCTNNADLIGMARAFIADPEWLSKARAGEADRIRPCLNFNQDCRAFSPHLHCGVNPVVGRETVAPFQALVPAQHVKSVGVIGGGPGGLEAALTSARRGHQVTVYEASGGFGGQFLYASSVPHRGQLKKLIDHQLNELRILGADLRLEHPVLSAEDLVTNHDAAIIATGATAKPLPETLEAKGARLWLDILNEGAPELSGAGEAVFVEDGSGFWWNYGVAEALAEAGWHVTLATPSAAIANQIPHESVAPLLARLGAAQTDYKILTALEDYDGKEVMLTNMTSGVDFVVPCDLLVVHTGRQPVSGPEQALRSAGIDDIHTIGDCITPRRVSFALYEAQRVARVL
jgi:2,4-dienoyl-CoA reductase (NADPH2)